VTYGLSDVEYESPVLPSRKSPLFSGVPIPFIIH
jgi:hypothetical protein